MSEQFLYRFTPGARPELATNPDAWTAEDEQIADAHVAYLRAGAERGTVVMAGRSQDGIGPAIVILEVANRDEAEAFMNGDPFVADGLFGADLHPFRVAIAREG